MYDPGGNVDLAVVRTQSGSMMCSLSGCFHAAAIVALMSSSTSAQDLYFSAASHRPIGAASIAFGTRDRIEFMLTVVTVR